MAIREQIFLSYAREDEAQVRRLYRRLAKAGFTPWMDVEMLLPGEKWDLAIRQALRASDFVIICLSSVSVEKRGYVQKEIAQALSQVEEKLEADIYLFPVRLDDCQVPERLSEIQWVDLFRDDGWDRLLKAIRLGAERMRKESKARPQAPDSVVKEAASAEFSGILLRDLFRSGLPRISAPNDTDNKTQSVQHNRASRGSVIITGDVTKSNIVIGNENRLDVSIPKPSESHKKKGRRPK